MRIPELEEENMEQDSLLSVAEVAALLGVTTQSVYRYIQRGIFPAAPVRIGGLTRWPRNLVVRWLNQSREAAAV